MSNFCSYVVEAFDEFKKNNEELFTGNKGEHLIEMIEGAREAEAITPAYLFTRALDVFAIDPTAEQNVWALLMKEDEPKEEDKWNWSRQLIHQGDLLVTQDIVRATREAEFAADWIAAKMPGTDEEYYEEVFNRLEGLGFDGPVINGVLEILRVKKMMEGSSEEQVSANIACDIDVIRKEDNDD